MKKYLKMNVEEAFNKRLELLGALDRKLYVSFSGGKDSLVLLHGIWRAVLNGKIKASNLVVLFVDEEAIYPCIEQVVLFWKSRMEKLGAKFMWLCLEWMHFSCFNGLTEEESFVCWDPDNRDRWVRQKPSFAITSHPMFYPGEPYQAFLGRVCMDGISVIGVRAYESVQRGSYLMNTGVFNHKTQRAYPIYDFANKDVWLYLKKYKVDIPECYLYMWKSGTHVNRLRVSQFFSIDSAMNLVSMVQFYPGLYEAILRREPNAYLAMYYFDSKMFRRSTGTRKKLEGEVVYSRNDVIKDICSMMSNPDTISLMKPGWIKAAKNLIYRHGLNMNTKHLVALRGAMLAGDPKGRILRSIYQEAGMRHLQR